MRFDIHRIIFYTFAIVFSIYFLICIMHTYFPSILEGFNVYTAAPLIDYPGNDIGYWRTSDPGYCRDRCNIIINNNNNNDDDRNNIKINKSMLQKQ